MSGNDKTLGGDQKKELLKATRPLTVYLGESGTPHDSQRVDILPPKRELSVSVDVTGVRICDLSGGGQKTIWSIDYDDLPV